jgi:hypothetical protein
MAQPGFSTFLAAAAAMGAAITLWTQKFVGDLISEIVAQLVAAVVNDNADDFSERLAGFVGDPKIWIGLAFGLLLALIIISIFRR